jgi:hypothetical protein
MITTFHQRQYKCYRNRGIRVDRDLERGVLEGQVTKRESTRPLCREWSASGYGVERWAIHRICASMLGGVADVYRLVDVV